MKILYVEDNEDNVYMLVRRLSRLSWEVLIAGNGE
jgi:CheY-like chemotaxis protein